VRNGPGKEWSLRSSVPGSLRRDIVFCIVIVVHGFYESLFLQVVILCRREAKTTIEKDTNNKLLYTKKHFPD